ncbi:MAG: hypothetical protein JNM34_09460 [Chthonomonadaceae bacterium]|nr:hypothetical protein [Chthonomonadaceae bacterium]
MKFQDYIVDTTRAAAHETFRYAKAVPADKVEWQPAEGARSVLQQCRELAMCPGWAEDILTQDGVPEWNEETMATIEKEQSQWTSVEQCEAECNRRLEKFFAYVQTIKDEDLSKTKWLPFDGGRDFTYMEMMDYPRWNFNYHLGQIGYIQIMYGDKDMH